MHEELTLLNRAKALDEDALAQIHEMYYDSIYRYISFRIADQRTAEDLTSEVFTRFLSAIRERSAPQNTIRGWLYGAASNVVKEQYRKQKREKYVPLDERVASQGDSPERRLDARLTKERLRDALGELTEDQQSVLALRFGYNMPIREVAQTVNKSEGSVKMLQARAIAALARKMDEWEVGR